MRPRGTGLNPLDKGKSFNRVRPRPFSGDIDLVVHRPESCVALRSQGALLKAVLSARRSLWARGRRSKLCRFKEVLGAFEQVLTSDPLTESEGDACFSLYRY